MDNMITNYLTEEINNEYVKSLLSEKLVDVTLNNIRVDNQGLRISDIKRSLKSMIKSSLPSALKKKLDYKTKQPSLDFRVLALRILIISKMRRLLMEDAVANARV